MRIKTYLKPFLNWRFLISFGVAWVTTNGWCYAFIVVGARYNIKWMTIVGSTYCAFLYLPFTVEKIVTIPLAIFIHTRLFKNDEKTHRQLEEMYSQAKEDWNKVKSKFKKKK